MVCPLRGGHNFTKSFCFLLPRHRWMFLLFAKQHLANRVASRVISLLEQVAVDVLRG